MVDGRERGDDALDSCRGIVVLSIALGTLAAHDRRGDPRCSLHVSSMTVLKKSPENAASQRYTDFAVSDRVTLERIRLGWHFSIHTSSPQGGYGFCFPIVCLTECRAGTVHVCLGEYPVLNALMKQICVNP